MNGSAKPSFAARSFLRSTSFSRTNARNDVALNTNFNTRIMSFQPQFIQPIQLSIIASLETTLG